MDSGRLYTWWQCLKLAIVQWLSTFLAPYTIFIISQHVIPPFQGCPTQKMHSKQGVALTGRNTTGPPSSVTDDDRRWQTTTDAREQNSTAPTLCVGGPVTTMERYAMQHRDSRVPCKSSLFMRYTISDISTELTFRPVLTMIWNYFN